jgi:cbb3-type cytochrome oxidase subunit 1
MSVTGPGTARRFILASLAFLILASLEGLLFPTKGIFRSLYSTVFHVPPQQVRPFMKDFLARIHSHMSLVGWVSCALMGILYHVAPQIGGRERYSERACALNFWFHVLGVLVLCIGWHVIGSVGLNAGLVHGTPEFTKAAGPYKPIIYLGGLMLCASVLLFSFNMLRCLCSPVPKERSGET